MPLIGNVFGDPTSSFRSTDLTDGSFAIATSEIALARSRNRAVRTFAQKEIAEHVKVARLLGAVPGSAPVRQDQAAIIAQLNGIGDPATFDAQYVTGQLMGHQELFALNANYQQTGMDPNVRAVVDMSLPIIRRHLAILHRLQRAMVG